MCAQFFIIRNLCRYIQLLLSELQEKGLEPLSDNSFGVILHEMGIQKSRIMIGGLEITRIEALNSKQRELPRLPMIFHYFNNKNK
jgi:hypothetical protein